MSIQNALLIIKENRKSKGKDLKSFTLHSLVEISESENCPCSEEDFKKAFHIDWKMRWIKYAKQVKIG